MKLLKNIINKLCIILLAATFLPPFIQPGEAYAAVGNLPVKDEVKSVAEDYYEYNVPASTDINSVAYNGKGRIVSKILTGTTLKVIIEGKEIQEEVEAKTGTDGKPLTINPGNAIWRFADGKRWQINTYNKSNNMPRSYNVDGHDLGGGVPYEQPAKDKSLTITTMSNYTSARAMAKDKIWVGKTTNKVYNGENFDLIDFSTWKMTKAEPHPESITEYGAVSFKPNSNGYVVTVDHLIHHTNVQPIPEDQAPPVTGKGQYVVGYMYAAPFIYELAAMTKKVYEYGGTITYTSNETPVDPCIANPNAPGCKPPEYIITGDFDIIPNEIEYRESFTLKPKNFNIPSACMYRNHQYIIRRDGDWSRSNLVTSQSETTSYSYSTYPNVIGVGTHDVSIKIAARCDGKEIETDWMATKPLYVNGPTRNGPPMFDAGFFREPDMYSFEPLMNVEVNAKLNLRIINDPRTDPPKPYDPDGDPIYWYWDFAGSDSAWIRSFPTEFGTTTGDEYHRYIVATELGRHCIKVTGRDPYGASTTRTVCINVVPPNPIPIISGPNAVVEGRPLPMPFDGSNSFSPMGRSISQYIWENVKTVYTTPGTEYITLEVVDSGGLRSLPEDKAIHALTVKPDLPPIADLEYFDIGIRTSPMRFTDHSFSPDGDEIVEHTVHLVCDANNNGTFDDDERKPITLDASGNFEYTPTVVGNCAIDIFLKEDWGKTAQKQFEFQVVNLEPEADFTAFGVNPEPSNISSVKPAMSQMMSSTWEASSIANDTVSKEYILHASSNALETRGFSDFAPYKSITENNIVMTEQEIFRSYCGRCGNTGSTSGYYYNFDPSVRVDKRLWLDQYYGAIYDEDRPTMNNYYRLPILSLIGLPHPNYYGSRVVINSGTGLIWVRSGVDLVVTRSGHSYTDQFYRFSDIKNYVPGSENWDGNVIVNPYSTTYAYEYCPTGKYTCYANEAPIPPPPSSFVMPSSVVSGTDLEVLKFRSGVQQQSEFVTSNFNKDKQGNTYKFKCTVDSWGNVLTGCGLIKYNSSGQQIWETSSIVSYKIPKIDYISSDSTKLIINGTGEYGLSYSIRNNSNGSEIMALNATSNFDQVSYSAMLLSANGRYFLGVYEDIVAYIEQTIESGFRTQVGKKATWELKFYNLITGQTTNKGVIKTFAGHSRIEYYGIDKYYISAMPSAVVSSDGKLILANYYSNVLVYDMKTFEELADIPTGTDPEDLIRYGENNGSYYHDGRSYYIKGITLTEDGRAKVVYRYKSYYRSQGNNSDYADDSDDIWEKALTIQTTPSTDPSFSYGYIYSQNDQISNGDLNLKIQFKRNTYSEANSAGVGFRSSDNKNMYRVEVSTGKVSLVKIVNGVSTAIDSKQYPIKIDTMYDLKVKVRDQRIVIYMNGVPIIDKRDGTFTSGSFGLYAEAPYVMLKDFHVALYEPSGEDVENQAIVNMPITYSKVYNDPENDPLIPDKTTWMFTNTQPYKFLDAGDGASDPPGVNTYDDVKVREPSPSLSRVGIYKVDLIETDDPAPELFKHPDPAFEAFQMESYPATRYIVVHRRPVAQFALSISSTDHTIVWNDTSYDPDRWLSHSNYSTEATGIDYQTTRGITDRKYYSVSPSGVWRHTKLIAPDEAGTYTVGLAVKDEYGAWSDWEEQEIVIETPVIDEPPTPGFTLSKTSLIRGETLTITSTAWDKEDGPAANLPHEYFIRNVSAGDAVVLKSTSRGTWTTVFDELGDMTIRQTVCDSKGQCASLAKQVTVVNRAPLADFEWSPKPAYEGDSIIITNTSTDPDNDALASVWTVTGPGGYSQTGNTQNLTIAGSATVDRPGTYRVTLTVRDPSGATSTAINSIIVHELGIKGMVGHTEDWDKHRLGYNERHPQAPRPDDWFWAGEVFVLSARVTDTGASATKPLTVEASAPHNLFKSLEAEDASRIAWQAWLRSRDVGFQLSELPQGPLTFTFTVRYSNGVVKTDQVTIQLVNTIDSYIRVHRVQ